MAEVVAIVLRGITVVPYGKSTRRYPRKAKNKSFFEDFRENGCLSDGWRRLIGAFRKGRMICERKRQAEGSMRQGDHRSGQGDASRVTVEWRQKSTMAGFADGDQTYLSYLRSLWRGTSVFGWYSAGIAVFRKLRMVRMMWRVIRAVWIALQTGTLILILLPVLMILLPGFFILSAGMALGGLMEMRRQKRKMAGLVRGKTVFLVWPDAELLDGGEHCFLYGQMCEWAAEPDTVVLVRSPFLFSSQGWGGRGFYWTVRYEGKGIYILRTAAFFSIRKMVMETADRAIAWY